MGFLDEIKKAIFGAKSVAKSSAQKAADTTRTKLSDVVDETKESLDQYGERAQKMLKDYEQSEGVQKVKQTVEEIKEDSSESLERIKTATENIGEKVLDASANILEKTIDAGEKLVSKSKETIDKADLDDKFDAAKDKVQDVAKDLKSKFDETMDRAQKAAADHELTKDDKYESSQKAKETLENSSFPSGDDDFWSKAEAFSDGRYEDVRDKDSIKVIDSDDRAVSEPTTPLPQFTDHDDDGDEIVDDAQIEDENDKQ